MKTCTIRKSDHSQMFLRTIMIDIYCKITKHFTTEPVFLKANFFNIFCKDLTLLRLCMSVYCEALSESPGKKIQEKKPGNKYSGKKS